MGRRLAIVLWWFGALVGALAIAVAASSLAPRAQIEMQLIMAGAGVIVIMLPCWAVAFVLGGSFWKPPR